MRIINEMEMKEIIEQKQKELRTDGYREYSEMARMVADWGIDQLEQVKTLLAAKAFDVTFSQYRSNRNGEK